MGARREPILVKKFEPTVRDEEVTALPRWIVILSQVVSLFMFNFSQTAGHAILVSDVLPEYGGSLVLVKDVMQSTGIPFFFLSRILHNLPRAGS
jgi:hypothetical protein